MKCWPLQVLFGECVGVLLGGGMMNHLCTSSYGNLVVGNEAGE